MKEHPNPAQWYALKDAVKLRCHGRCEYCCLRWGTELHHRHYETWGCEAPSDVMLVCAPCHQYIHGFGKAALVRVGSLADLGDSGREMSSQWLAYLA